MTSIIEDFDVWEVLVLVNKNGYINKITEGKKIQK